MKNKFASQNDLTEKEIEEIASQIENVKIHIGDSQIKKSIYVKDKLLNFVI